MRFFSRMAGVMLNYTISLRNWKGAVLILGIVIIFSGCGSTHTMGRKLDDNSVKQIKIGMTTKNEVIQLIGNPSSRGVKDDTEIWSYSYQEGSASTNAATFIPVVGIFAGGTKSSGFAQNLTIIFKGKGDVVAQCTYGKSTISNRSSSGIGITNDPGTSNSVTTDCEKAE